MKVIVAGYPKTGTKTMCAALGILGYTNHDFLEQWWYHGKEWSKILTTGGTVEDFKKMYEDVDGVTDVPAFYFWEEIHKAFPDSKIILTLREEDSWYKSFANQNQTNKMRGKQDWSGFIKKLKFVASSTQFNPILMWRIHKYLQHILRVEFGLNYGISANNEMVSRMKYRHHNHYVLENAPKDKLLVFRVTDGWEPLCKFLGREIPDRPFPHKNANSRVVEELIEENPLALENMRITKQRFVCIVCVFMAMLAFWLLY